MLPVFCRRLDLVHGDRRPGLRDDQRFLQLDFQRLRLHRAAHGAVHATRHRLLGAAPVRDHAPHLCRTILLLVPQSISLDILSKKASLSFQADHFEGSFGYMAVNFDAT